MKILDKNHISKEKISEFFAEHWGSSQMVVSTGVYECSLLDGFVVTSECGVIKGLITFQIDRSICEIISLDSIEEGRGIGTALLKQTEKKAAVNHCKTMKLITTNDNVEALRFYQKRGYILSKLLPNAVEKARVLKPSIPHIGNHGIPLRDEIELRKQL
ncbi:GNAT family N-acetyltransferase [Fictibacillus iocasae]|uniref:GNAT family N-acetyltransferase n=1 Tax=Fictibacillus iocasae TaxID=2715437 RepID=A0ABW2NNL4_9BACL